MRSMRSVAASLCVRGRVSCPKHERTQVREAILGERLGANVCDVILGGAPDGRNDPVFDHLCDVRIADNHVAALTKGGAFSHDEHTGFVILNEINWSGLRESKLCK